MPYPAPSAELAARAARAAVLQSFRPDSCIATTRVVISVLRHFGITARPLAVRAAVFNRAAWDLAARGVPVSSWPPQAHSVGISAAGPHRPGRWDGHLVAITTTHLIDGSLDQMSRPDRAITLPGPGVFPLSPAGLTFRRDDGTVIMYEPVADPAWGRSADWSADAPEIRRAVGTAIRNLRAAV